MRWSEKPEILDRYQSTSQKNIRRSIRMQQVSKTSHRDGFDALAPCKDNIVSKIVTSFLDMIKYYLQ